MAEENGDGDQVQVEDEEVVEEVEEIPEAERVICAEPPESLIAKNTESFTCLAQLVLSRSSLLRHPLYHFPPLEDPGIDLAFRSSVHDEQIDYIGVDKYRGLCKDLNIMPLSRVIKSLDTSLLNLSYYGLTHKQMKAITKALRNNVFVTELNLEENYIDPDTAHYLGEMLRENYTLVVLKMRECRIGPEGAQKLSDGILTTQSVVDLDLSCNSLGSEGMKNLKDALKDNCTIQRLNLSKNDLGDESVPHLSVILNDNFALEHLDLSWNRINSPQAWKQLVNEGLLPNKYIRSLNLSWNAISSKLAMKNLMKFTSDTETLEHLNLSNNMIGGELARMMKGIIMKNHSLLELNIGFNPLTPADAQMLIELLLLPKVTRPKLEVLNMDNVYVKKDFLGYMKRAARQEKRVTIGGVLGNWTIKGPDVPRLLFERCRMLAMKPKKKKLQRDFGHFIFALPDKPMSQSEFTDLLNKFKMKMVDKDLVDELMNNFKFKKKGVDAVAMREKYLEMYPDAEPPPKKQPKKKGKKKKEKAEIQEIGDQGEEGEWSQQIEEDEFGEEEDVGEEEEKEGETDEDAPLEVAHGESVTDVIAQLEDTEDFMGNELEEKKDDTTEENKGETAEENEGEEGEEKRAETTEENKGTHESVTNILTKAQGSGGFAHLEPISEVSEA